MVYVYVSNQLVADRAEVNPYSIFSEAYASQFIEAPDEVQIGWTYINGVFAPYVPTPEEIQAQNKSTASQLLTETDWTTIPDVSNPDVSNPYLINSAEFAAYRSQVRAIAVNPPTTPAIFPAKPNEQWSS